MPIYEYQCQTCSVRFERKQSVHDESIQTCPDCGGKVRKIFHPAGIIFKGSGFYKTDYASSSSSAGKSEDSPSSKSEPAKADAAKSEPTKSESSKPETTKSEPAKSETKKTDK